MKCSNSECSYESNALSAGTLYLLEFDQPSNRRIAGNEHGFPSCLSPRRYFWLCASCSRQYVVKKWTEAGVLLEQRVHPTLTEDGSDSANLDQDLVSHVRRAARPRHWRYHAES